ncbi:hypothetical protein [Mucilaginibacter sp. FT3.2]|uniref:hypothetical protein n=1 Tax=Mucilaginibacter sp. FT3.2 TaxID=2723090 RepID=UPI00161F4E59|nr:hypothetical protein [Mucilaginibacter sp. FT3.2]MBB6233491.1 hypothetical protein [Mucilaginibacter sp. FT3.2]
MPENTAIRSSWFNKFFECLFLYVALVSGLYMAISTFFYKYFSSFDNSKHVKYFLYAGGFFLLLAVAYSIYWHRKEKSSGFNSGIRHAWFRGVMRYFIAYEIAVYGFAKILQTQFSRVYSRDDIPVGDLTGFELTWNYFGHSYTFAVILGLLQIGGSIMLLFRRTTLLGACILLPVMVNIVLLNIFYEISNGAFVNSLIFTAGLSYIIILRWADLKILLFQKVDHLPPVKLGFLKPIIKVMTIAFAFYSLYRLVVAEPPSAFEGKWKIYELTQNGKDNTRRDWQTNPRAWHTIYIEQHGELNFSSNPFIFEREQAWHGSYTYNAPNKTLNIIFYNGPQTDTTKVKISGYTGKMMQWDMIYYADTIRMKLLKAGK